MFKFVKKNFMLNGPVIYVTSCKLLLYPLELRYSCVYSSMALTKRIRMQQVVIWVETLSPLAACPQHTVYVLSDYV